MQANTRRQFVPSFESLESRQLLSASTGPTAGIVLHEQQNVGFTADLGNFITLAPGTGLKAIINWGDGTTSKGVLKSDGVVGLDEVNFEVDGSHTYLSAGTFDIQVHVVQPAATADARTRSIAKFSDTAIVTAGKNILLGGTITGTYSLAPTAVTLGAGYVFNGTGSAGQLGPVSAQGIVYLPSPFVSPIGATGQAHGTLTLTSGNATAAGGSVTLALTGPIETVGGPFPTSLSYTITGGTGIYAGASGEGTIQVKLGPGNTFTFVTTSLVPPILA